MVMFGCGVELLQIKLLISTVLSTKEDEIMLLKMKKQLGNPDILRKWVKGFEYCGIGFNKPPNSLVYIACTSTGRVNNLRIKNLDFLATFPYAICGLTELDSLEIYNWPELHGPIPPCIRKLVNLRSLVITDTYLSDSLPSFSKNTNLFGITLSSNRLSGTIPPSLSKLLNLSSLDLSSNFITGTIPPKIVRGHSPTLFLSNNHLTGEIPNSYKSIDFKMINLGDNQLNGDASFLFGKQKTAVNIVLANNEFEFNLSVVKFSDKLYKLDLSHNKIYGNVPDSFASATGLQDPNLSFNRLCGELPKGGNMWRFNAADFVNNTCLCGNPLPPCFNLAPTSAPAPAPVSTTQFYLAPAPSPVSTALFDSAPAPAPISTTLFESAPPPDSRDDENILLKMKEQLGNHDIFRYWVKGFDYCGIGFTNVPDSLVVVFCTDTGRVFKLIIRNLDVFAPFPDAICEFTKVETIEIYHFPGLHGPIPSCISELVNLRSLIITQTSLSGYVPNFSNNTNLLGITLSSNELSGTIPTSLSTLPNLNFLDLGSNYLTGNIPPGLFPGDSPVLFLSNNNLSGEIPKSYGLVNFFMIHVGNNQLSGDASFLFGKQKTAINMDLANNNFEFDLNSVELSDRLNKLDLSHNKIYGNVPDSFASATRLSYLNLSFNRLCGELPKGGNMWIFNAVDFVNNTCLCGNPLPPCFNSAPAPAPEYTTP
ncbi:Polygalacturonase inhibitor [Carex littledalei]|uniref:Polygalacturonase inhibitor n=1 Tax=Carex littledalei TaxID=544730 RepID=A0A833R2S8_9POAL|nr:Polygalacturonase inhibitor [Carex littledalei]